MEDVREEDIDLVDVVVVCERFSVPTRFNFAGNKSTFNRSTLASRACLCLWFVICVLCVCVCVYERKEERESERQALKRHQRTFARTLNNSSSSSSV